MHETSPVKGIVGGFHLDRVPTLFVLHSVVVVRAAARISPRARLLQVRLQLLGYRNSGCRRLPVIQDDAFRIDPFAIANSSKVSHLSEKPDAATREAQQAVDLEIVASLVGIVVHPVLSDIHRLIVFAAAEAPKDIQVGEPAAQEVGHSILSMHRAGSAASEKHAPRRAQMVLPRHLHLKGVGRDDLEGGKHDGGGQVDVGHLPGRVVQSSAKARENISNPMSDPVGGFSMVKESCSVAGRVRQKQMQKVTISNRHYRMC